MSQSYNAPEVFNQKCKPIRRAEMKKCDIWAFGLLAWEVLLYGKVYTATLSDSREPLFNENAATYVNSDEVLSSALNTATASTERIDSRSVDDIQRAIFKHLFRRTLQSDPDIRIGRLDSLAFMSKWK